MASYKVTNADLSSVANAIRTKGGTSAPISFPSGFVEAIGNISGGGASNFVTGTFKGTTAGGAIDVSIPYTGSGHPISGIIYPSGGGFAGDIESLVQKFACFEYAFSKMDMTDDPTFSGNTTENKATVIVLYKYSDSDATSSTAGRKNDYQMYQNSNASATSTDCVKFKSKTTMSVYIASTSYGFPKDIEFTYQIVYSA